MEDRQFNAQLQRPVDGFKNVTDELKPDINEFLFSRLPGEMTLAQVDKLACKIYQLIEDAAEEAKRQ